MAKNLDNLLPDRVINPRNMYPINGALCTYVIYVSWKMQMLKGGAEEIQLNLGLQVPATKSCILFPLVKLESVYPFIASLIK